MATSSPVMGVPPLKRIRDFTDDVIDRLIRECPDEARDANLAGDREFGRGAMQMYDAARQERDRRDRSRDRTDRPQPGRPQMWGTHAFVA